MIVPAEAGHQGRAQGPGGVHAGAGQGDGEQVTRGDGQSNGQGGRALTNKRQ